MKFCKDCKFIDGTRFECRSPNIDLLEAYRDPVMGGVLGYAKRCDWQRERETALIQKCGRAGDWFEPKG